MNRRQRKRQARIQRMLDVAMSIVNEEGYDALTVSRLAEELDVAVGGLYRYFDGKEALILALEHQAIMSFQESLRDDLERAQVDLGEAFDTEPIVRDLALILVCATAYTADARNSPGSHRLIDESISNPAPLLSDETARKQNEEIIAPLMNMVATQMINAAESGALDPGDAMRRTYTIWTFLHGLDHFRKMDRFQVPGLRTPLLFEEALCTLLQGWGAELETIERALRWVRDWRQSDD